MPPDIKTLLTSLKNKPRQPDFLRKCATEFTAFYIVNVEFILRNVTFASCCVTLAAYMPPAANIPSAAYMPPENKTCCPVKYQLLSAQSKQRLCH